MGQVGFYINQAKCTGCKACQIACKDKNDNKVGILFRRVYEFEEGISTKVNGVFKTSLQSASLSISCNHCDNPKCVQGCPTGAMHKRESDGVVLVDHEKCVGCKYCTWNCPYGAPQFNDDLGMMTKCDTCLDLREKGENPACVDACPFNALEFGEISELRAAYGTINEVSGLPSAKFTNPNIVITPNIKE
ncbi:DMSO/selenate family reductase complex B subunit [Cytobacillus dafuensis]|uniref:Dimethylsulfoxide reductase subunit B n=1 Tax=Cytobacillus dafuensis TaxID=1742359 RepID=A0A5B8Z4A6_CYTDA|nr:DMSO/selenate family reductase complex B subunit [Cytobacillus dafuensis]QED47761.1 dimethylsulfoxide reductase subunit B [Cytobacillus dafuensis]